MTCNQTSTNVLTTDNTQKQSNIMDSCLLVEKDVDKLLAKFTGINNHATRALGDLVDYIKNLKQQLDNGKTCQ